MLIGFGGKARWKETAEKILTYLGENIKIHLREIGWLCMHWIHLA
jgi:hypothetical protein